MKPPRHTTAVRRIFNLSLGLMLWSRRTVFMVMVVGGPVLLAIAARLMGAGGPDTFGMIVSVLFLRFCVPLLGVFYGTSLIADEVDDKTITYLFTRPIQRGAMLLGKYLAYLTCTTLVVLPAVTVVYLLLVPFAEIPASFGQLLADLGILAVGLAAYGALFALTGAVLRRPLVIGLVFAFGWEQLALVLPGYLRRFTLAYHLQAVYQETPSAVTGLLWLVFTLVACLAVAARAVERREYVLERP